MKTLDVYVIKTGRGKLHGIFTGEMELCSAIMALPETTTWKVEKWEANATSPMDSEVITVKENLPGWEEYQEMVESKQKEVIRAEIEELLASGSFEDLLRVKELLSGGTISKVKSKEEENLKDEDPVENEIEDTIMSFPDALNLVTNKYGVSNDLEPEDYLQIFEEYNIKIDGSTISSPEKEEEEFIQKGLFEIDDDSIASKESETVEKSNNSILKSSKNVEIVDDLDLDDEEDTEIDLFNITKDQANPVQTTKSKDDDFGDDDEFDLDFSIDKLDNLDDDLNFF